MSATIIQFPGTERAIAAANERRATAKEEARRRQFLLEVLEMIDENLSDLSKTINKLGIRNKKIDGHIAIIGGSQKYMVDRFFNGKSWDRWTI